MRGRGYTGKGFIKILSSEDTRLGLMTASVYLAAYELVKASIVEQIKFFVGDGNKHHKDILSLHRSELIASCLWLKQMGAITDEDVKEILEIREHRNKVAHELPAFLVDDAVNINAAYIHKMRELLTKIDIWWFMQIEAPTNPDLSSHPEEIAEIKSGPMLVLERLMSFLEPDERIPEGEQ